MSVIRIRYNDRPEADADLPSCVEISCFCNAKIEAVLVNAKNRHRFMTRHVPFLRVQATRAMAIVQGLESAFSMADPHLAREVCVGFKDNRDVDPFGTIGEGMFIHIDLALKNAQALSKGWSLRLETAETRKERLENLIITCTEQLGIRLMDEDEEIKGAAKQPFR